VRPIKLVYDHQIFSLQSYGGISRYVVELAVRLAEVESLDVKIFASAYINQYLKCCSSEMVLGFHIKSIHPKLTKLIYHINSELAKFYLYTQSPDIVHHTYYTSKNLAPKTTKTVITVHDMIQEKLNHLMPKSEKITSIKMQAIRKADHIICNSHNTKKDLLEILNIDPQKVSVIYHGCSSNLLDYPKPMLSGLPKPYILYVGQRTGYKNFEQLLRAYAASNQLRHEFHLVCFGGGSFSKVESDLLQKLGLPEGKVQHFSGSDRVLAELYYQATAFVYPSLYEGFGIPLLEAMSLNCPVICSNTSSMPEVAGNAAEFFDPHNQENVIFTLEKVLSSENRLKNLRELGQERIRHFSWENCAKQTQSVYLLLV
jgi:glycosyltransferase involved in cell wall biosynthesis